MTAPERLYGVPGAEILHTTIADAYEAQIDPWVDEHDLRPRVIEEWSVHPPEYHLPSAERLLDWLVEQACEDGEVDEGFTECLENAVKRQDALVYADTLRKSLGSLVTYRMADDHLRDHQITWDDNGNPLADGEPMYVKADGSPESAADGKRGSAASGSAS